MCRACSSMLPDTSHSIPGVQLKVLEYTIYDLGGSSQQASFKCFHCQTGCHAEKSQHSTTAPQPARMGRTTGQDFCCRCPCRSPRVRRAVSLKVMHIGCRTAHICCSSQAARRKKIPGSLISEPAHNERMVQNPLVSILLLQPLHTKLVLLYATIAPLHDYSPMYEIPESMRQDVRKARQGLGIYDCPRFPPILLLHFWNACISFDGALVWLPA